MSYWANKKPTNADYARLYESVHNATKYSGAQDDSLTFKGWQHRTVLTRAAALEVVRKHDEDIKALSEDYTTKKLNEIRIPLDQERDDILKIARNFIMDDLDKVIQAKRAQFSKAFEAPTEAQVRLLQTLALRDDLTAEEVAVTADKLGNNAQSLKALGSIAKRCGLKFPEGIADPKQLDENIEYIRQFVIDNILDAVSVPDKQLTYNQRLFYIYPDDDTGGRLSPYLHKLDTDVFTAAKLTEEEKQQCEKIEKENSAPQGSSYNAVRVYLRGNENLSTIAMQFGIDSSEIRKANPKFDFSRFYQGESIIVPAGKLKIVNQDGCIGVEQCVPCRFDAETLPKSYHDGDEVNIEDLKY